MTGISIVIPVYNSEETICETLDSALSQLEKQDEIIIVDDGSTDNTRLVIAAYTDNPQVDYCYQDNAGVSAARNRGIDEAGGEYILFLDSDDCLLENTIQKFRSYLSDNLGKKLVCAGHVTLDDTGKRREHRQVVLNFENEENFVDYVLNKRFSIPNGAVCIHRSVLQKLRFSESLPVSEDFCLYAQILANYDCGSFVEPTVEVKKHDQSLRHRLDLFEKANNQIADILFDEKVIPASLLKYKQQFICNRKLALFRAQYMAGEAEKAMRTYRDAIACRPLNLFRLSYLRKYLRLKLS